MRPIFIPPPIRNAQKCPRCSLQFPLEEDKCTHCSNLNSQELLELMAKVEEESKGNKRLILYFGLGWLAVVIIVLLLI